MKIGFIGIGVIGTAMVHGFCMDNGTGHEIYLSPRSKANSELLSEKYLNVKRMKTNQEVVDNSECIVLALNPSIGEETVKSLDFNRTKRIINLMADAKLDDLKDWIGKDIPITQVIPMPCIESRTGPIVIYPKDNEVAKLLGDLGEVIQVEETQQMRALQAITALPATYYTMLYKVADWGKKYNLTKEVTSTYTTSLFAAISVLAKEQNGDIKKLIDEMTEGGLNVMVMKHVQNTNGVDLWIEALEKVMERTAASA